MRPRAHRIVLGQEPARPGEHARMVVAAADHARAIGLAAVGFKRSRSPGPAGPSPSFYLCMRDRLDRDWLLRISDHYTPRRVSVPHLDLVSRDGIAGRVELLAFIDRIAEGAALWHDHKRTELPRRSKRGRCS